MDKHSPPSHRQLARASAIPLGLASLIFLGFGCSDSDRPEVESDAATTDEDGRVGSIPTDAGSDASEESDSGSDAGIDLGRVVVFAGDGHAASLEIRSPWTIRATTDLGSEVSSARCRGTRCVVAHPAPKSSVDVIDARDLSVITTLTLADGADPRDAAWIDDDTILVSQYGLASLVEFHPSTKWTTSIDLGELADDDGIPESGMIGVCGRRAYVQLGRLEHEGGSPSALGAVLAVIDFDRPSDDRIVDTDPKEDGAQGVALAARADFDMPIDCAGGKLFVAEPAPLFSGGGAYEVVDLTSFVASEFPIDSGAQVGGFEVVSDGIVWRITHTDFGPGASSHLECVGCESVDTYNTFSGQHVDDLALDRVGHLLFFPDPCVVTPSNSACEPGVHVFHALTGAEASAKGIDVGFEPIEIAIAR